MSLLHFDATRPKVGAALRILQLPRPTQSLADLKRRCTGLYQGPDGDTWINDSMGAAERNMAADAYRFLQQHIQQRDGEVVL